ncbi:MAG: hypothetical protein Q3971_00240 [Moraxella sp.]|nr:hypothetical protein [Moraxella sp.]
MKFGLFVMALGCCATIATADDTMPDDWINQKHQNATQWLGRTAHHIDDWFGSTDPNKPARASVRVMLDVHNDKHSDIAIKPRIRAKIKLPTLENRLSVLIGDDGLDDEQGGGVYNDGRLAPEQERTLDRRQSRKDNTSLALRWSKFKDDIGVQTDLDLGVRSSDVYLRWRGEKRWQMGKNTEGRFEQMYRYGTKSEHFALTTLEFSKPQSTHRTIINRSHLAYTNQDHQENIGWGNSLYEQHLWGNRLGTRSLSYGLYAGGTLNDHQKSHLNTYGPYVSYRQPIWREWLFVQGDVGYYNNKDDDKDHHISTFGRLEVVF